MRQRPYHPSTHVSPRGVQIMSEAFEAAVMKLDGIDEFKLPAGVAQAAVEDGRPYRQFLEELLRLGLEVHLEQRKIVNP
jgi:hypothetical protein